ncbi:MAG: FliM/FliN family flagellar motor switch protein [Acidobacteriia bacterium]|nr:FliM/FliN family flagellar motor switch protein [Terriglobia bacterium]
MSDTTPGGAFLELEFPVEVWLAAETVPLERLLDLEPGGLLPLSKDPDGPVDLVVNREVVASGELVIVDGKFGFRVTTTALQRLARIEPDPGGKVHP